MISAFVSFKAGLAVRLYVSFQSKSSKVSKIPGALLKTCRIFNMARGNWKKRLTFVPNTNVLVVSKYELLPHWIETNVRDAKLLFR